MDYWNYTLDLEQQDRDCQGREVWEEIDSPNAPERLDAMGDCEVDGVDYEF
jgi:hypothetical protein